MFEIKAVAILNRNYLENVFFRQENLPFYGTYNQLILSTEKDVKLNMNTLCPVLSCVVHIELL